MTVAGTYGGLKDRTPELIWPHERHVGGMNRVKNGDFVRRTNGDWRVFRVTQVFDEDSPYFFGVLVTTSRKYHTAGEEVILECHDNVKPEPSPAEWAKGHWQEFHPDIQPIARPRYA